MTDDRRQRMDDFELRISASLSFVVKGRGTNNGARKQALPSW